MSDAAAVPGAAVLLLGAAVLLLRQAILLLPAAVLLFASTLSRIDPGLLAKNGPPDSPMIEGVGVLGRVKGPRKRRRLHRP